MTHLLFLLGTVFFICIFRFFFKFGGHLTVGGISILLLREGGVAESRGGRWIHNADNNRLTHSPTTSPYGYSSFLKEESGGYYQLSNCYFPNQPYH